jgi:hypothetical protein
MSWIFNHFPQLNGSAQKPVVRLASETDQRELTIMRWGLIPFWSKDSKIAYSTIDAKAEAVATSPTCLRERGVEMIAPDRRKRKKTPSCAPQIPFGREPA